MAEETDRDTAVSAPTEAAGEGTARPAGLDRPARPTRRGLAKRGYAGRTAQQLREERRQRLLEAALALFTERGYHRTPIELLCARARVTTRHFYEHFDGREAVLRTLYQDILESAKLAVFSALRDIRLAPAERMQLAVSVLIGHYTGDPRRARIACVEVLGVSPALSQVRRANLEDFARLITAFIDVLVGQGALLPRDYGFVSTALVGAISELLAHWVTADPRPEPGALVHGVLGMVEALILGSRGFESARPANLGAAES